MTGYRAWCDCHWSGGPEFRRIEDAHEHAQRHADGTLPVAEGGDALDTLQAISELPSGSVIELADGQIVRIFPMRDRVEAEFFARPTRNISWLCDLPVRVIKRG